MTLRLRELLGLPARTAHLGHKPGSPRISCSSSHRDCFTKTLNGLGQFLQQRSHEPSPRRQLPQGCSTTALLLSPLTHTPSLPAPPQVIACAYRRARSASRGASPLSPKST